MKYRWVDGKCVNKFTKESKAVDYVLIIMLGFHLWDEMEKTLNVKLFHMKMYLYYPAYMLACVHARKYKLLTWPI